MKIKIIFACCALAFSLHAQTVRYVTLFNTNTTVTVGCAVQPNELIQLFGGGDGNSTIKGQCAQGSIDLVSVGICSGLTNITLLSNDGQLRSATFSVTTPNTTLVISNYIPADAIVIPASETGSAQIILESSPDLVNWTAANPGIYAASAGTNRFFRVRASSN